MAKGKEFQATIESKNMEKMFTDFERQISAKDLAKFIDFETGKILTSAAQKTKQSAVKKLNSELERLKQRAKENPKLWPTYKKQRDQMIVEKKRRIGLAKQAWLQLAEGLRLQVGTRGLGRAKKAKVFGKVVDHNGVGKRVTRGRSSYAISIIYRNPIGAFTGAIAALRSAIEGRARFFKRNLKLGVFKRAKDIAKRYPGIEITPK